MSEKSYLGIDIGSSNIKVVELSNDNGRPFLVTYGFTDRTLFSADKAVADWLGDTSAAAEMIKGICAKAKTKSKKVVSALSVGSVFSSVLTLSNVSKDKKEIDAAVKWQAKKVIPMPLEEMTIHWVPLGKKEEKTETSGPLKVLLTAAPQKLVKKYIEIFRLAKLELISLETESFALIRSLVGNDQVAVMIIDVGYNTSSIIIVRNGVPIINKSVEIGGMTITKAIGENFKMDLAQAEKFKQDFGVAGAATGQAPMNVLQPVLNILEHEINYCLNSFSAEDGYDGNGNGSNINPPKIEKIILAGGSTIFPGLAEQLSKDLNLKVYIGDPWARTIYPEDLKPVLDEVGPKLSVAVGLAMRDII